MPLSVWIVLVVIAFGVSAYKKYRQKSAVQQRGQFLREQRQSQVEKDVD